VDQKVLIMVMAIVSLVVSTIMVLVIFIRQRAKKKEALSQLPAELKDLKSGRTITGEHDGTAYDVYYFGGSKNAPPYLAVSVAGESEGRFRVKKESGLDRFFKRYGIAKEVQTLDKAFDDDYFILSDTVDFARQFFQPPEKREAVHAIFRLGYTVVEHDGKTMKATCTPFRLRDTFPPDFVTTAVSRLAALSTDIPLVPQTPSLDLGVWKTKRAFAFAVPILGLVIGAPLWILGIVRYPPLDGFWLFLNSLKYSLPLLFVFLWSAVRLLRGRSTSHHELIVVGILALIAFPSAAMGTETFFNGWLDGSPSSPHTIVVLDKYVSTSGKTTDYVLVLESWRPGRQTEKLEVSSWAHQRVVVGQTEVTIETKPGRFRFEWMVSYRVLV
jgi:hypothetical protein